MDEQDHAAFAHAVAWATNFLMGAEETGEAPRWATFATNILLEYCKAQGVELPAGAIPAQVLIAWEGFGRHCVNCLCYDEDEHGDLSDHESGWEEWARAKLAGLGLTEEQRQQLLEAEAALHNAEGI